MEKGQSGATGSKSASKITVSLRRRRGGCRRSSSRYKARLADLSRPLCSLHERRRTKTATTIGSTGVSNSSFACIHFCLFLRFFSRHWIAAATSFHFITSRHFTAQMTDSATKGPRRIRAILMDQFGTLTDQHGSMTRLLTAEASATAVGCGAGAAAGVPAATLALYL